MGVHNETRTRRSSTRRRKQQSTQDTENDTSAENSVRNQNNANEKTTDEDQTFSNNDADLMTDHQKGTSEDEREHSSPPREQPSNLSAENDKPTDEKSTASTERRRANSASEGDDQGEGSNETHETLQKKRSLSKSRNGRSETSNPAKRNAGKDSEDHGDDQDSASQNSNEHATEDDIMNEEDDKASRRSAGQPGTANDDELSNEEDNADAEQDSDENQPVSGKRRRTSRRRQSRTRRLRPRISARLGKTGSSVPQNEAEQAKRPRAPEESDSANVAPKSAADPEKTEEKDFGDTPKPALGPKGKWMQVEDALFVTEDQLDNIKLARLSDKNVKPFEYLTFQDLRTYNRDQLRAYCFAYGMARRKKTEMEADMARYLSYWNTGRPGFALHEYVPTSSRVIDRVEPNPADSLGNQRTAGSPAAAPESREGSVTPSVGLQTEPASQARAAVAAKVSIGGGTPSRSATRSTTPMRPAAAQGISGPKSTGAQSRRQGANGSLHNAGSSQTTAPQRNSTTVSRAGKAATSILPRSFGTSFKQRLHARQAGAKFKAAYAGAGPAIVNIVENAAAYFEGQDSKEVVLDQAKSYERYQFNVDMLNELFDGARDSPGDSPGDAEEEAGMAIPAERVDDSGAAERASMADCRAQILRSMARTGISGKRDRQDAELDTLEQQFKDMEEKTKYTERSHMRLFQRLERAETMEQIEAVKREIEEEHGIELKGNNSIPLVRREVDKSLAPQVMTDEKSRILRFKVS